MIDNEIIQGSENVFEDLGFSPQEAEHLRIRSDLMLAVRTLIEEQGWTSEQAAVHLGQSVDCIEALLNGKIGQFSIDQLITMLTQTGRKIRIEVLPIAA